MYAWADTWSCPYKRGGTKMIKVYSTPTCTWCVRVKEYLNSKNIQFQDVNVAEDSSAATEMIEKTGQRGVPVLDINGNMVIGFNKEAIDQYLDMLD